MTSNLEDILKIENIEVMYDSVISALHDVSLTVPRGKIVALLGGNGAGKSTTLKAISTMLASERGKITKGKLHTMEPLLLIKIQLKWLDWEWFKF